MTLFSFVGMGVVGEGEVVDRSLIAADTIAYMIDVERRKICKRSNVMHFDLKKCCYDKI
jgi:hypothetical protein